MIGSVLSSFQTIDFGSTNVVLDFCFTLLALAALNLFVDYFVKRKFVIFGLLASSILYTISYSLCLTSLSIVLLTIVAIIAVIALFVNLAETRYLFANKFSQKGQRKVKKENGIEKLYNHEDLYKEVNDATLFLSKHKIGAIMTFVRKDNLDKICKNGTTLNAPVTYELLITIFYPGTRLHDGAVVIKGNTIQAASVYYTPTTKPLIGKYGSRHRAAIGISEICDAVTVVVSEETGRISIAYNGELESYSPENFYKAFENIMSETDVLSADTSTGGKAIEE